MAYIPTDKYLDEIEGRLGLAKPELRPEDMGNLLLGSRRLKERVAALEAELTRARAERDAAREALVKADKEIVELCTAPNRKELESRIPEIRRGIGNAIVNARAAIKAAER